MLYIFSKTWRIIWLKSCINSQNRICLCSTLFIQNDKVLKVNIWSMIEINLMMLSFFCWIYKRTWCVELSLIFFGTAKQDCVIKKEIYLFFSSNKWLLLSFLLLCILAIILSNTNNIFCFLFRSQFSTFL